MSALRGAGSGAIRIAPLRWQYPLTPRGRLTHRLRVSPTATSGVEKRPQRELWEQISLDDVLEWFHI